MIIKMNQQEIEVELQRIREEVRQKIEPRLKRIEELTKEFHEFLATA